MKIKGCKIRTAISGNFSVYKGKEIIGALVVEKENVVALKGGLTIYSSPFTDLSRWENMHKALKLCVAVLKDKRKLEQWNQLN